MNEYLMRSLMFVPAHNQKLLDSSLRRTNIFWRALLEEMQMCCCWI